MRRRAATIAAVLWACSAAQAQTRPAPRGAAEILQEMESFRTTGTVLLVAAHPDDEDSQLTAYFARGRGYRTAYLSLNRGEGGQNLIGPEFGDELGVIRTEELLAARRIDGAEQFFTRARDFGYSKSYKDTLRRWDHREVLADVVRVIREFRPDVVITRFSPEPGPTHGHHTASAVLTLEAFQIAGDPKVLPEELQGLAPWKPRRVAWDITRFGGGPAPDNALRLDIGGFNPILGESYGEIAARSRSMHKTQGFGSIGTRGTRYDYFRPLAGDPPGGDLFDGIDTTWSRYPGGAEIARLIDAAIAGFDPRAPSKSVAALLAIKSRLGGLRPASPFDPADGSPWTDPLIAERTAQLGRIIQGCLGLWVETTVSSAEGVPGESLHLRRTAIIRSDIPAVWNSMLPLSPDGAIWSQGGDTGRSSALRPNVAATRETDLKVPLSVPPSQPYWLAEEGTPAMFKVGDRALIGRPESPPPVAIAEIFTVGGQELLVGTEPVQVSADPARGEIRRPLSIIPPVSLALGDDVALIAPGASHAVSVAATAARPDVSGVLRLEAAPAAAGWTVTPSGQTFHLAAAGESARLVFTVTAPPRASATTFTAAAVVNGVRYDNRRVELRHDHIPFQLLQPPARLRAVSLDLAVRARRIGYLPGAGDDIPAALGRMGCTVVTLSGEDLTPDSLKSLDAVVIGIRAFNTRTDLAAHLDGLFAYVAAGGTVVEQYNTPNGLRTGRLGPYPLELDRDLPAHRVTDEKAAVTLLEPADPAFNTPNRITLSDFDGWVQERGLDFPSEWDSHYSALLECHDSGDEPLRSGLLVARYGRGAFVVTGLSFFRQLPAGVPGAYRLFANLVSLGKQGRPDDDSGRK